MNFVPFENIEVESPLKESEIEEAIKKSVAWSTELGITFTKNSTREYEGYIDKDTFQIRRILKSGRNSFIPIVTGKIVENGNNGSIVDLKFRPHKLVQLMMAFFLMIIVLNALNGASWSQLVIYSVFYLISMYFFNHEVDIVKYKVKSILKVN